MIRFLQRQDFVNSPWKNGKGVTTQLCIFPADASMAKNNFIYRFSSAPIRQDGEFSIFPGMKRILLPVSGAGFQLNDNVYEKFEIAHFSGDEKIFCRLLKGPVTDLGIIYDPQKIRASTKVLHLKSDLNFSLEPGFEHFFFVLDGAVQDGNVTLNQTEGVHFINEPHCSFKILKSAVVLYVTLQ